MHAYMHGFKLFESNKYICIKYDFKFMIVAINAASTYEIYVVFKIVS
jgi:hypothetical protein